jgi:hypothetical protein
MVKGGLNPAPFTLHPVFDLLYFPYEPSSSKILGTDW